MKVYSIAVLSGRPTADLRAAEYDLTSFGFFQRGGVQEFMGFTAKTLADRTAPGERKLVKQDEYHVYCHVRPDTLAGVLVADREYPQRVAFAAISKVLDDFASMFPASQWASLLPAQAQLQFPQLREHLQQFQDPASADSIMKVQLELDETKIVLHNNINALLERGEKIDDLVARSEGLSTLSKAFYTQAKRTNSCCKMM